MLSKQFLCICRNKVKDDWLLVFVFGDSGMLGNWSIQEPTQPAMCANNPMWISNMLIWKTKVSGLGFRS